MEGMNVKRSAISKRLRFEVFKRDSFKCQYCGASAPEAIMHIDHIHPVSKGGDNDTTNLITACADCNGGKSNIELSDNSAIAKQKAQLDELNEKREQLEMMLKWRKGLKSIDNTALSAVQPLWSEIAPGFHLNEKGLNSARTLVSKFGLQCVLDSMEKSRRYIRLNDDGLATQESVDIAWAKVGGICNISSQPDWMRDIHYIKGICRNRFNYCNQVVLVSKLKKAYESGAEIDDLKSMALECTNWTQMNYGLDELIGSLNGAN